MIQPFHGLRPTATAGDLSDLVSPPYDKIDAALLEELRARSPRNAVHLVRGERDADDDGWYSGAADRLAGWVRNGHLARDIHPSWYVMRQTFRTPDGRDHVRTAVIGALDLNQRKRVLHHEQTHRRAREDRLALLRATGTHLGQIFILRQGEEPLDAAQLPVEMVGEASVEPGVVTAFARVIDDHAVTLLEQRMAAARYVIADGHHRFTTACNWFAEEPRGDRVMVAVVDLQDPGLCVLPTHRCLSNLDPTRVPMVMEDLEGLESVERGGLAQRVADEGPGTIGLVSRDAAWLWRTGAAGTGAAALDVAVLKERLLDPLLEGSDVEDHLSYHRDPGPALEAVASGAADLLALVPPIPAERVMEVAAGGEVMPAKSTDFHPKIPTGFVYLATPAAAI